MMREQAEKDRASPVGMVRVKAKNDLIAKFIKNGARGFNKDGIGVWPMDQFTRNRVRDGDVTLEKQPEQAPQQPEQAPQQGRHQSESEKRRAQPRQEGQSA
jgi:hypothetical protein